jgi:serine/threonine-protein kinase
MAPEQAQGAPLGPTADIYAIGTLLYELLSGRLPFDAEDQLALLAQRLTADPIPLDRVAADVPSSLVEVVMRALARDPAARPPTARNLGAEVAAAASDAWGPDWLERSAVNVLAPMAPEARTNIPPPQSTSGEAVHGSSIGRSARGTRAAGDSTPVADEPVRPTIAVGENLREATPLGDVAREDLVAVQDVLTPPPVPRNALLGLVVALVALVVVAFAGLGSPSYTSADVEPGTLVLGGHDLSDDGPFALDLGSDIALLVDRSVARRAASAELTLTAAGLPAGGSGEEELVAQGEGFLGALDVGNAAHVTSGDVTGELRLLGPRGQELFADEFGVQPDGAPWLTLTFAVGAIGLLVALTYAGSTSAPLRAGRRHRPAMIGLPIVGGAAGLALTILLWSLGVAPEPSILTLVASVVLGAVAGGLAGPVLFGFGRRRRLKEARRG